MTDFKKWGFAFGGLAVLAVLVVAQFVLGDRHEPAATPGNDVPTASATITTPGQGETSPGPDGPSSNGPSESPAGPGQTTTPSESESVSPRGLRVPAAAIASAEKAAKVWTEYSWRDGSMRPWMDRVRAISNPEFSETLHESFGDDVVDDQFWSTDVAPVQRETRTTVEKVALDEGMYDNSAEQMTFAVRYKTSVHTSETNGWTDPDQSLTLWVTLKLTGAEWRVKDIQQSLDAVQRGS